MNMNSLNLRYPPLDDCVDFQRNGRCVCWSDLDEEEYRKEQMFLEQNNDGEEFQ